MTEAVDLSFEERLARLTDLVEKLENPSLALEESVSLYKEGLELSRRCRKQLDDAKNEVSILAKGEFEPYQHDNN
jgi:exodeoxyribonuclease VII small subunit